MSDTTGEFYEEFYQDVMAHADAVGTFTEDSFFEVFTDYLIDAGELETADRAALRGIRGIRVDGYGGDPRDANGVLTLIVLDFNQSGRVETLTATELGKINKRVEGFVRKSLDPAFRDSLEESQGAYGLAALIDATWPTTNKVRVMVLSDRVLSSRVDSVPGGEVDGTPITHNVWDLGRLHKYVAAGREREDLEIDLVDDVPGGPMPALPAGLDDAEYDAYLAVVPGAQLAEIYDRWSTRLLEQNVRVFLQGRGAVNRGMRITLESQPEMFFAFNNGITATAEDVQTQYDEDGLKITRIRNLQIVNGGQTTASVHAASLAKVDLSRVFVQMKLSIIEPEQAIEVVPRISLYANSQNAVRKSDFFSNHPYQVRIEELSRRVIAPAADGALRGSHWYYERARGQYQDERSREKGVRRKEFDLRNPRAQLIHKTDLAKFLMVWEGKPQVVSQGAQRNFDAFANMITSTWEKDPTAFSEAYWRTSVAKAIVFKRLETLVMQQPWYAGGYRANVVAYAIAKLAHDLGRRRQLVDFAAVWKRQAPGDDLEEALVVAAGAVHDVLVNPADGHANVTEWAKKEACWTRVQQTTVPWPDGLKNATVSRSEAAEEQRAGSDDQRVIDGIQAQTLVVTAGGAFWKEVRQFGIRHRLLSETEQSILAVCARVPSRIPSDKQSIIAVRAFDHLKANGFTMELPSGSL